MQTCASMFANQFACHLHSTPISAFSGKITNGPLRSYSLVNQGGAIEKVDCKVTHWKHEACNATCGEGFRWKYRSIIVSFYDTDGNKS